MSRNARYCLCLVKRSWESFASEKAKAGLSPHVAIDRPVQQFSLAQCTIGGPPSGDAPATRP